MQQLIYHVATTLDGFIARPDGTTPGFAEEGDHVDAYRNQLNDYAAIIMGRTTYEAGYAYGMAPGDTPYGPRPHYVFSATLDIPESEFLTVVRTDALSTVDRIKKEAGGDIYLCGGGKFAGFLLQHQRIDVLRLKVSPIVYGEGIKLFEGTTHRASFTYKSTTSYESGVLLLEYRSS